MPWSTDFLPLAEWALRVQDLRHRYLYAPSAKRVLTSPGIAYAYETMASLAIFDAALGKGYVDGKTIWFEKPYPSVERNRADLAFKDPGVGKPWAYIEIKHLSQMRAPLVRADIEKLKAIDRRAQRWLFVYGVHDGTKSKLASALEAKFASEIVSLQSSKFETIHGDDDSNAVCELCLVRLR